MPVSSKPNTSMALLPEQSSNQIEINTQGEHRRPARQPTSLQGLLRFAMEATKMEDAPHDSEFQPMDEERRKFLEEALKSMTIDVVEVLQKQIEILKKVEQIKSDDNVTEYIVAIETISDYIDNIDIANDFHKIGGFMILYPCMKSSHPKIRAGSCDLLAVLCQNNPYCQSIVLTNEFVPLLIKMIEKDEDTTVVTKALYALSAIVRDNEEGFNQMVHYKGPDILLKTIKKNNEKFIIKATFMLTSLCRAHLSFKDLLIDLGYVSTLIMLIASERSPSHEHMLSLLICLVEDSPRAIEECKSPRYNLKDFLQKYIASVRQKEEYQEEEEYCKRLLHLLNANS